MPTITADKVLGRSMYAKGNVAGVDASGKQIKTFSDGQLIGVVDSWVNFSDGLYWSFYNNYAPYYVKHDGNKLSLPALPDILKQISAEEDKKKLQTKGVLQYNIDKYLPWIIGAAVIAISLPTVSKLFNKK
jgi:hypothetical protein